MSINLGNAKTGSLYHGSTKIGEVYLGSTKVYSAGTPAIATRSMRFDFKYDHFNPITDMPDRSESGLIWTHVADDIYDFHYDNANWGKRSNISGITGLFDLYRYKSGSSYTYPMSQHQFDVLDMDLTGVTTVSYLFNSAWSVQNISSIRNTSSVTDFSYFIGHSNRQIAISIIPLFDTSSATNVSSMFNNCRSVESGALALYQQMSTQTTPPTTHTNTFQNCGSNTVTGAAELAQIPTSWGGTMT